MQANVCNPSCPEYLTRAKNTHASSIAPVLGLLTTGHVLLVSGRFCPARASEGVMHCGLLMPGCGAPGLHRAQWLSVPAMSPCAESSCWGGPLSVPGILIGALLELRCFRCMTMPCGLDWHLRCLQDHNSQGSNVITLQTWTLIGLTSRRHIPAAHPADMQPVKCGAQHWHAEPARSTR